MWRGVALPALREMGRVFIAEKEKRDGRSYLNKGWGTGRCVCGGLGGHKNEALLVTSCYY